MGANGSKKKQVFKLCRMCHSLATVDFTSDEITDKFAVESTLASDDDLTELGKFQNDKKDCHSFISCVDSFSSIGNEDPLKPLDKSPQSRPILVTQSATLKRRALLRQRQMNLKSVSLPQQDTTFDWTDITNQLGKDGKGAYFVFSSGNNGSFFIEWSQTFNTNALLFCKPSSDSNIPLYKYSSRAKEELIRGVFVSLMSYAASENFFFSFSLHQLLPEYAKHAVELKEMLDTVALGFYHKSSMQVHTLDTQPEKSLKALQEYEGAIAVYGDKAFALLIDLAQKSLTENVSLSGFLSFGSEYGVSMKF